MSHEQLFDFIASKTMKSYCPHSFKKTHPTLHEAIMLAMDKAAIKAIKEMLKSDNEKLGAAQS